MASGLWAWYAEGLMTAPATDKPALLTQTINVVLGGDANNNLVTQANLEDETIATQDNVESSTSAVFEDDNLLTGGTVGRYEGHSGPLSGKTVGVVAPYVFDADDTDVVNAPAGPAPVPKDVLMTFQQTTFPEGGNFVLAWFDLTNPPTPNGNTISIVWNGLGIFKFATVV